MCDAGKRWGAFIPSPFEEKGALAVSDVTGRSSAQHISFGAHCIKQEHGMGSSGDRVAEFETIGTSHYYLFRTCTCTRPREESNYPQRYIFAFHTWKAHATSQLRRGLQPRGIPRRVCGTRLAPLSFRYRVRENVNSG